jgi:hypothetical protein
MTSTTTAPAPADIIVSIYNQAGRHIATSHGPAKSLSLWRNRWVRSGYIARQIDGQGRVREYGN